MSVFRPLGPLLLVLAMLASPAMADKPDKLEKPGKANHYGWQDKSDKWQDKHHGWQDKNDGLCKPGHGTPPTIGAPEIDPGSAIGGLILLAGGAFILADRRRCARTQLGVN